MNKKEIKEYTFQKIGPYFSEQGFTVIKTNNESLFNFEKKTDDYFYSCGGYTLKYDNYKLIYGFSFGIRSIVNILRQIDAKTSLSRVPYNLTESLIGVSPGAILFPKEHERPYKYFSDEYELELCLFDVMAFYQSFFLPFCDKYKSIDKLDLLFNDFRDFKTDNQSFPKLAFFHVTRLIIARLANNPEYEKVVEKNFEALEFLWEQDGGKYDRLDDNKPEVFAAKYLRDLKV